MYVLQLFGEHQHLLIGERLQVDNGSHHVLVALAAEMPLGKSRAQGFIGVDASTTILDRLGRTAHYDAKVARFALQGIVIHGEDLLVIVLAGDGVGNLIDVYQLIHEHKQPRVARLL